jgi:hypothetical protein
MKKSQLLLIVLCGLLTACTSLPDHPEKANLLPPIFPDYKGVTIPAGIAPLNFDYSGPGEIQTLDVTVKGRRGEPLHANGDGACFDIDAWHQLTRQNRGDSLMVTVSIERDGKWTEYRSFPIYVSNDKLGEWGVTYRLIPPGYETYGNMGIYQRDLSNYDETAIMENSLFDTGCINCHTPNRTNPDQFTFHVRGDHGATVIGDHGHLEVLAPKNADLGGGMVYPCWHPSGKFIAYSTNKTKQSFHQLKGPRVEVYDEKSDIIIYRPSTHEILLDSLLATPDHQENYPTFSPDGRTLYFCAAQSVDNITKNYKQVKYNLCRVGFDAATGSFIGPVDTLLNARRMGKSANMPRVSFDGRFLLYSLCNYGCFPIWHPEADLWITDLKSGQSRPLTAANSSGTESFHSWSLNSRWIVFSSRRDDGLYTKLYIAHIDAQGRASKPFLLPQRNPRQYDDENIYSFNTPDFARKPLTLDKQSLSKSLMGTDRTATKLVIRKGNAK